jgi:hypothetical protein
MQKAAIQVEKTYQDNKMPTEFIIKSREEIQKLIEHAKADPDLYGRDQGYKDNLNSAANLSIEETNIFSPKITKIPILAIFHYQWDISHIKSSTNLSQFIILLIITSFLAMFVYGFCNSISDLAKRSRIEDTCKVFWKNGELVSVEYKGQVLKPGPLSEEEKINMNPWLLEWAKSTNIEDCIQITVE